MIIRVTLGGLCFGLVAGLPAWPGAVPPVVLVPDVAGWQLGAPADEAAAYWVRRGAKVEVLS